MAYTTKAGNTIPCQFDLRMLPAILTFRAITDASAVAELKARLQAIPLPLETDEYAHLRLRGTHEHLGRLISTASTAGACAEMINLLSKLREGIAKQHDALPTNPDFPRARLAKSSPENIADWAAAAEKKEPELAPVANEPGKANYTDLMGWD